jgi:hypothetical protein
MTRKGVREEGFRQCVSSRGQKADDLKAIFNDYWSFYCSHASLTGRDMF